jgi:hypothetical protein
MNIYIYIYIYIKDRDGKNTFTCDLGRVWQQQWQYSDIIG